MAAPIATIYGHLPLQLLCVPFKRYYICMYCRFPRVLVDESSNFM